ncbi:MAG: esterase [Clostridia bacterium]|nr:esterase [Clostridia bacterium]
MDRQWTVKGRSFAAWGHPEAADWLVQPLAAGEEGMLEGEYGQITASTGKELWLIGLQVARWREEMSPWSAPPVFGQAPFGSGAKETLAFLLDEGLPSLRAACGTVENRRIFLGGYSLAGLFALWAGYQTTVFDGIAAVSPSVWFPGWMKYIAENTPKAAAFYLSLGDREEKTRNPIMAQVGQNIRAQAQRFTEGAVLSTLEWNVGNHFANADLRTAKGFAWLLKNLSKKSTA